MSTTLNPIVEDNKAVVSDPSGRWAFEIGGKDKQKVIPCFTLSFCRKGNREAERTEKAFFHANAEDVVVTGTEDKEISSNKVEVKTAGRADRFYMLNDDSLEYEIELSPLKKPAVPSVSLKVKCSPQLIFEYQPEFLIDLGLTEDQVCGYNIRGDQTGNDFEDGYFGAIGRAWIKVDGKKRWINQSLTVADGEGDWVFDIPKEIYDQWETYSEIIIGPTLGNSTTSFNTIEGGIVVYKVTLPVKANITKFTYYNYGGCDAGYMGIYADDAVNGRPGALVGATSYFSGLANGWHNEDVNITNVAAGVYWLALVGTGNIGFQGVWGAGFGSTVQLTTDAKTTLETPYPSATANYTCKPALYITYTEIVNTAPNAPTDPSPADGTIISTTLWSESQDLFVDVTDDDADTLDVSFYDASDDSLIGTHEGVVSGGTATVNWPGLEMGETYSWYAIANDGTADSEPSPTVSFKVNSLPTKPVNPTPEDEAIVDAGPTDVTLSVETSDEDESQTLHVYFYNAETDEVLPGASYIEVVDGVAEYVWENLPPGEYSWYAIPSDGLDSGPQSDTFTFTVPSRSRRRAFGVPYRYGVNAREVL